MFTVLHILVENSTVEQHQCVRLCGEKGQRKEINKSLLPAEMQGEQVMSAMVGGVHMGTGRKKVSPTDLSDFFQVEQLGTHVDPKCGGCRSWKCPVPGSRFSFREELELKMVDEGMRYDEARGHWIAAYPRHFPRELLKGTLEVAKKSLFVTERKLRENPG